MQHKTQMCGCDVTLLLQQDAGPEYGPGRSGLTPLMSRRPTCQRRGRAGLKGKLTAYRGSSMYLAAESGCDASHTFKRLDPSIARGLCNAMQDPERQTRGQNTKPKQLTQHDMRWKTTLFYFIICLFMALKSSCIPFIPRPIKPSNGQVRLVKLVRVASGRVALLDRRWRQRRGQTGAGGRAHDAAQYGGLVVGRGNGPSLGLDGSGSKRTALRYRELVGASGPQVLGLQQRVAVALVVGDVLLLFYTASR